MVYYLPTRCNGYEKVMKNIFYVFNFSSVLQFVLVPGRASIKRLLRQNGSPNVGGAWTKERLLRQNGSPNVGGAWTKEATSQNAKEFLAPKGTFITKENGVLEEYKFSPEGINQARFAGHMLLEEIKQNQLSIKDVRMCYSPFSRTRHTAEMVASVLDLPFEGPQCKEHRDSLKGFSPAPYQKPPVSVRRPLIPAEHEPERQEGLFVSLGELLINTSTSVVELFGGLSSGFRK